MSKIPKTWMPKVQMRRIVCHWTAGTYQASALDRKHYHILVEGDGNLVRGKHSIADNQSTTDGKYAAHTARLNTGSIGLTVCCMAGARERPFDPGRFPMTERQWRTMAQAAADLCVAYEIPVTSRTVLGHGEVQRNLGVAQSGKWDPMALPWEPRLPTEQVGERFRELVRAFIDGVVPDESLGADLDAKILGVALKGSLHADEEAFLKVESLVQDVGWQLLNASRDTLALLPSGHTMPLFLNGVFLDGETVVPDEATESEVAELMMSHGYVRAAAAAAALELPLVFDLEKNRIEIGDKPPRRSTKPPEHRRWVVEPGDTLYALAARHLGNGARWHELLQSDGQPFDEASARLLAPGDVVLIPGLAGAAVSEELAPPSIEALPVPEELTWLDGSTIHALAAACVGSVDAGLRRFAEESIPVILAECLASGVNTRTQIAYVLATSEHESQCGKFMVEIWGPTPDQKRYEGRKDLDNTQKGDGFRFRGRGYVQITGRHNYRFWSKRLGIDLLSRPDLTYQDPSIAARILVQGMRDGTFRPAHKLPRYVNDDVADFYNAREVINGDKARVDSGHTDDRGTRIARIAERYLSSMS